MHGVPHGNSPSRNSLVIALLYQVGQVALPTVIPVEVHRHENSRAAELMRALTSQTRDFLIGINLVELEHSKLHLLALGVSLLLAFLSSTCEFKPQEQGGIVLKAAIAKHLSCDKRTPPKVQKLLSCWHTSARSNLLFQTRNIRCRVRCNGVGGPTQISYEELHRCTVEPD